MRNRNTMVPRISVYGQILAQKMNYCVSGIIFSIRESWVVLCYIKTIILPPKLKI